MVTRTSRGRFISFEGPEGSGKSSQVRFLAHRLRQAGVDVSVTREPGGTRLGKELRSLLLEKSHLKIGPEAEALIIAADRAQHVSQVIRPQIESGKTVVCDRYVDSTFAYQGFGSGIELAGLMQLTAFATGGLVPDLTILVDIDPAVGLARRRRSHRANADELNRFDKRSLHFHQRVRAGFLELASQNPDRVVVVDGNQPPSAVFACIWPRVIDLYAHSAAPHGALHATQLPFWAQGAADAAPSLTWRPRGSSSWVDIPRDRRGRWVHRSPATSAVEELPLTSR